MAEPSKTEQRKAEHVNIILQENVSAEYNYWNDVKLVHRALPEIDLDDVDVDFREGAMDELHVVPIVVLRGDVLLEDDVHVLRLALFRLRRLRHLGTSRLVVASDPP